MCTYLQVDDYCHTLLNTGTEKPRDESWSSMMRVAGMFRLSLQPPASIRNFTSLKDIYYFLVNINMQEVTDPRDRIYGVLALLPAELRILPDYTMTVDQVFTNFTLRFINWSQSLNILRLAGWSKTWLKRASTFRSASWLDTRNILKLAGRISATSYRTAKWQLALPSWVPYFPYMDWNGTSIDWNASRGAKLFVESKNIGELTVRGHIVGTVASVGSRIPMGRAELSSIRRILADWRKISAPQHSSEQSQHESSVSFWRELAKSLHTAATRIGADVLTNVETTSNEFDIWLTDDASALGNHSALFGSFSLLLGQQAMFRSDRYLIGLCIWDLQPADVIVILAGCDRPLILRRQQDALNKYTLVDDCTCSGLYATETFEQMLTYSAISHGEHIHDAAKLRVSRKDTKTLPTDVHTFYNQ